jgi:fused signal recognition particle receptor
MFRKLALFCILLALLVIVLGSYVRLSDAGLGCPDWPACYGQLVITDAAEFTDQAEANYPQAKVEFTKAIKEMTHRYSAGLLGFGIVLLVLLSFWQKQNKFSVISGSMSLLLLIALQAVFGMWAVQLKVMPVVVTGHLLSII